MKKVVLILIMLAMSYLTFCEDSKGIFYKATKGEKVLYFFGSIHLAHQNIFPLDKNVEESFDKAKDIVMEIDEINAEKEEAMVETLMNQSLYFNGDKLKNHISQESVDILKSRIKEIGSLEEYSYVDILKPWAALLLMESLQLVKIYGADNKGIEKYFLNKRAGKKLKGLETIEEQMKMLTDYTDAEVEESIKSSQTIEETEKEIGKLETAWKIGDEKSLTELVNKSMNEDSTLYKRFITDRNRKWIGILEKMLEEKQELFIIVGAGHLTGRESVVKLFEEKGYKIEKGN